MINAPVLVLTAAGLSVIAKGGIPTSAMKTAPGGKLVPDPNAAVDSSDVFRFWAGILGAAGGILVIDRFNGNLASGLAALWIVGSIISNGSKISPWLTGFGKGVSGK